MASTHGIEYKQKAEEAMSDGKLITKEFRTIRKIFSEWADIQDKLKLVNARKEMAIRFDKTNTIEVTTQPGK